MITFKPGALTLSQIQAFWQQECLVELDPHWVQPVAESRAKLIGRLQQGQVMYGVNTGFGKLAETVIPQSQLSALQENLVLSHAAGVGENTKLSVVRLMMLAKVNSLAQGYSGVRPELVDALLLLINKRIWPVIPARGSVGASGDLAPLAHMSMALLGYGKVVYQSNYHASGKVLLSEKITPLILAEKEGLALINGTQFSTALAMDAWLDLCFLLRVALVTGALSHAAVLGHRQAFDHRIHQVRRQTGQMDIASVLWDLVQDYRYQPRRVQDPYCLRCMPQVMGAGLDQLYFVGKILLNEMNAVSDNPLIFDDGQVLSGGNFHAEPVAMAADNMAMIISEIGALSERRIAMLTDQNISGLPAFLVKESGVNSGFMIAHVTAAALASENKTMCFPSSVDSIPTSANQEDHVSMAPNAARRLQQMNQNLRDILAIELLCAAQGIDFGDVSDIGSALQPWHKWVRQRVEHWGQDRYMAAELQNISQSLYPDVFPVPTLPDRI